MPPPHAVPAPAVPAPAATPEPSVSARDFSQTDEELRRDAAFLGQLAAYDRAAPEDAVERTVRSLLGLKYDVHVVDDERGAVRALDALIQPGMTYSSGGSTTLTQIGWPEHLAARTDVVNLKGQAIAAAAAGDRAKQMELLGRGASADVFVSSVHAITEPGVLHAADMSGTRISGWVRAERVLVRGRGTDPGADHGEEAGHRGWHQQNRARRRRGQRPPRIPVEAGVGARPRRVQDPGLHHRQHRRAPRAQPVHPEPRRGDPRAQGAGVLSLGGSSTAGGVLGRNNVS